MPNPFLPSLQPSVIISLQSLLCNKQSLPTYYTHSAIPIPHSRFSLHYTDLQQLSPFSSSLCFTYTVLLIPALRSIGGGASPDTLQPNANPSTHASHSIRRFSFETERLVSPSFSIAICLCVLHGTARHCTAQHGTARHSTALHGTAPQDSITHAASHSIEPPSEQPVMTNKDPTAIHTEIEGP